MRPTTRKTRLSRRFGACIIVATLPAFGCGGGTGAEAAVTAAVDTVNGVERLRYPAEHARSLAWTVDTAAVLGDAFAEDAYQFNEISREGIASDPDGSFLVLDRQGKRVLRYGRDGVHLATYGRQGEGPGELGQPLGLDVGPGDTIWVSDIANSRLTGYPRDGGEPRSVPFPDNAGFPSMRMAVMEGGYVFQFRPMFNFRPGSSGGGFQMSRGDGSQEERPMLPLIRYDRSDFHPRDTLWVTPEPPTDMVQLEMGNRLMVTMMGREFHPRLAWAPFSDGGLVVSDTAAYLLHLLDSDGRVERIIERGPAPRPVTEADREAARQRLRDQSDSGGGIRMGGGGPDESTRQRMLEQRLEKMTFADLVPRIVRLGVDARDRIWVGVSDDAADEVGRIDIYDRQGALVGQLRDFTMPDAFLADGRVAVLRRDDLDVQQVVVLDVREGDTDVASAGS